MTTTDEQTARIVSDEDLATLNAARTILNTLAKEAPHTWSGGVLYAIFDTAEDAVFQAINVAHNYGGQPMTYEQLHNRPEEPS